MSWLDALRGIAALVVVFDHSSYSFMAEFRRELMLEFNTSRYGIMVFFLVSGYIIPASLERRGSIRTFWIGRIFRIYPLWAAVAGAVLTAHLFGIAEIRDFGGESTAAVVVAHVTLFQELLGTPNLLLILWTLSYEMAFYLLVVALFSVRLHQQSATFAVALAALAAISVAAGAALPVSALSGAVGVVPLVAIAAITMAAAIGCASAQPPVLRVLGAVLGGMLALVLVTCNGTVPMWEGLVILSVMFLGTAVYRAERRQSHWRRTVGAAAVVVACAVGSAYRYGGGSNFTRHGWIVAFLLAVATFGIGLALRRRRIPRWLIGLGTISYSVYMVHPVLLAVSDGTIGRWERDNLVLEVAFYVVLLPVSVLTYRYIETPGQAWGRRLARRIQAQRADSGHRGAGLPTGHTPPRADEGLGPRCGELDRDHSRQDHEGKSPRDTEDA
ncbi:acyltransferase family protein [Streptomyces sp. KMM 9044]|uniref:acyltransferase family protein n=1 Tax=Streptomyces sp. KMM 9044 TaxID=2744474 RepID=UPI00215173E9|nr:acyltransferase [Streptomyces sp. KMM 9044]WAX79399.1 acyltransferase [Streptomyces sp. KMM 9044]